jgi:hypothetical protein
VARAIIQGVHIGSSRARGLSTRHQLGVSGSLSEAALIIALSRCILRCAAGARLSASADALQPPGRARMRYVQLQSCGLASQRGCAETRPNTNNSFDGCVYARLANSLARVSAQGLFRLIRTWCSFNHRCSFYGL